MGQARSCLAAPGTHLRRLLLQLSVAQQARLDVAGGGARGGQRGGAAEHEVPLVKRLCTRRGRGRQFS